MTVQRICDWCGIVIQSSDLRYGTVNVEDHKDSSEGMLCEDQDICVDCFDALFNFIEQRGKIYGG